MARRLANRGHEVIVYAPIRDDCPEYDGKARWLPLESADFSAIGTWILSRCPSALDNFPIEHLYQHTWLVCQDVFYPKKCPEGLTDDRILKLDRCLPLCTAQEKYLLQVSPTLNGKMNLSSNGINVERIEKIEALKPQRDPFKLVYSSSPDRGLPSLLKIFRRAREFEPRLSLTVAYGWDNISKCKGKYWRNVVAECEENMKQPGVNWLGRVGQERLYSEFLSAGLWVYPTTFTETSCITCMEAQAMGAIPITNPLWAIADNVRHGIFLNGDPANEPLVMSQYAHEIRRLTGDISLQEHIRPGMMKWAREKFDWERVVDNYELMANYVLLEELCS